MSYNNKNGAARPLPRQPQSDRRTETPLKPAAWLATSSPPHSNEYFSGREGAEASWREDERIVRVVGKTCGCVRKQSPITLDSRPRQSSHRSSSALLFPPAVKPAIEKSLRGAYHNCWEANASTVSSSETSRIATRSASSSSASCTLTRSDPSPSEAVQERIDLRDSSGIESYRAHLDRSLRLRSPCEPLRCHL